MQLLFTVRGERADLMSYFLGKHPDRPYEKKTPHGIVRVKFTEYQEHLVSGYIGFYPDSVKLTQNGNLNRLDSYIHDRAFVLSSLFLSQVRASIGHVLSLDYPDITRTYDIELTLSPLSTHMTDEEIARLYTPLGYDVQIEHLTMKDAYAPDLGQLLQLTIRTDSHIPSVFRQLFVLLPVLDNYKHYRIHDDEMDKLERYGEGWLPTHPDAARIIARYLRYHDEKVDLLCQKLGVSNSTATGTGVRQNPTVERLRTKRYAAILEAIRQHNIHQVVDMGAGEGNLLEYLIAEPHLREIIACEPSESGRLQMHQRLGMWRSQGRVKVEPVIMQSSLLYHHVSLRQKECVVLCEVVEHIEPDALPSVIRTLCSELRPQYIIMTTPNRLYNPVFGLDNRLRHRDHRFEWSDEEMRNFFSEHVLPCGYTYTMHGVGPVDEQHGQPTLFALLTREESS